EIHGAHGEPPSFFRCVSLPPPNLSEGMGWATTGPHGRAAGAAPARRPVRVFLGGRRRDVQIRACGARSAPARGGSTMNPSIPETMKAAAFDRHGGPEVIHTESLPVPKPAASQVLIRTERA